MAASGRKKPLQISFEKRICRTLPFRESRLSTEHSNRTHLHKISGSLHPSPERKTAYLSDIRHGLTVQQSLMPPRWIRTGPETQPEIDRVRATMTGRQTDIQDNRLLSYQMNRGSELHRRRDKMRLLPTAAVAPPQ